MAICIRHGSKALRIDSRRIAMKRAEAERVLSPGEVARLVGLSADEDQIPAMVEIVECRACLALEPETKGRRAILSFDAGPAPKARVSGDRFPGPDHRGKVPLRLRPKRRMFRGRTGGERTLPGRKEG